MAIPKDSEADEVTDSCGIDWLVVRAERNVRIGAVGFLGDEAVVIAPFYDDRDLNRDNNVSYVEHVITRLGFPSYKGRAVMDVASWARVDDAIASRDASFQQTAMSIILKYTQGAALDGATKAWLGLSVARAASALVGRVSENIVENWVARNGAQNAITMAARKALGLSDEDPFPQDVACKPTAGYEVKRGALKKSATTGGR